MSDIDHYFSVVEHGVHITIPSGWTQERTVYGGLSAALLCKAMSKKVSENRALRTVNTTFSAPLIPDVPLLIQVEMLREGKTISQLSARAIQNTIVCVQAQAVFAKDLAGDVDVNEFVAPTLHCLNDCRDYPPPQFPIKGFMKHFKLLLSDGDYPFSASRASSMRGWMKYIEAPSAFEDEHLIALIDVWPPATLMRFGAVAPASTVNWSLQFVQPHSLVDPNDYVGYQVKIRQANGGFGYTDANIWSPAGELLAISSQTVVGYSKSK